MPIKTVALAEATPEQLGAFARNFLNLDVPTGASDDALRSAIETAQPGVTTIFYQEADTLADVAATETTEVELRPEEAVGRSTGTLGAGDPRAVIFIAVEDKPGGANDVLVGVNGRGWQLKRGYDLSVPWRVVEALQNGVANIVEHSQEPESVGEVIERKARRFPFSFIERPPQAEIDAWMERTGAEFCA